jgi:hypothetical protein
MRLNRVAVLMTAGLVAVAGTAAGTALAAPSAPATARQVVLVNACSGHGQIRPGGYQPGCMASQEFITGLKWTSWRSVAFGGGVFKVNNCTPTCAQGKYVSYPILTVLWRAEPWPHHSGQRYFTRMTVIFTSSKHPRGPAAQTLVLPAS